MNITVYYYTEYDQNDNQSFAKQMSNSGRHSAKGHIFNFTLFKINWKTQKPTNSHQKNNSI